MKYEHNKTSDKTEVRELGKYKLSVENGIIKIEPKVGIYYTIAEDIANDLYDSGTDEWRDVCLTVINTLDKHSQRIKDEIVGSMTYATGGFYAPTVETVKGRTFAEAKAYIEGCESTVKQFKEIFEEVENSLKSVLDTVLPTANNKGEKK